MIKILHYDNNDGDANLMIVQIVCKTKKMLLAYGGFSCPVL